MEKTKAIDDAKQIVPVDFWNPTLRDGQILYYKNGLAAGEHTLKIVALSARNPYAQGDRIYVKGVQFSAESKADNFPTGTGPTGPQRMIFGYTNREDYRDSQGGLWRPATEVVSRFGTGIDTLAAGWWTNAAGKITAAPGGGGSERKQNVFRKRHRLVRSCGRDRG